MISAVKPELPRVGMCVLRVERRGTDGVVITVTASSDISVTAPGRSQPVADVGQALALVAGFLREYLEDTGK